MMLIALLMGIIMITTETKTMQHSLQYKPSTVLQHKENDHIYWHALMLAAKGDKKTAQELIESVHTQSVSFEWQKEHPAAIDDFFDKLFFESIKDDPETLTFLSLFESIGVKDHNAQLSDLSIARMRAQFKDTQKSLQQLKTYSIAALTPDQKVSYEIFSWLLEHTLAGEPFMFHRYCVTQMGGFLMDLVFIFTQMHTIETAEDAQLYVARLGKIPHKVRQGIAFIKAQQEAGIVPPRFIIQRVIDIITKSLPENQQEHIFYAHLKHKIKKQEIAGGDQLLERALHIVTQELYPSYQQLAACFIRLQEGAQHDEGVWALPNGDAFYAYMLKDQTTTDLTAQEIHDLGLQEVASIHSQMRSILAQEQLDDPSKEVGALVRELSENEQFYYPNTDAGRAECMAEFERIMVRSREQLAHLFGIIPKIPVKMARVPEHEEQSSPGAYYLQPSIDGTRPGVFYVNLRDMKEVPKYGMETLAVHEAEPGHHFQLALQSESQMPILRKLGEYTAYAEGWALYTEKLAYEHGFYSSSFAKLGHLQDELMRAARLVIDTGIHYKRWSREQAIEYMQKVTGYHYNTVVSEVERYFVMPGQACAYKVGQLKILELRKRAQDALQDAFDIREFHDVVLGTGIAPLVVLESVVDRYIHNKIEHK